jgi:hypothetical protein
MKKVGMFICAIGSGLAILFPPISFMGMSSFGFIFGNAGFGVKNFQLLNPTTLLVELLIINGIGLGLYFAGKRQESVK